MNMAKAIRGIAHLYNTGWRRKLGYVNKISCLLPCLQGRGIEIPKIILQNDTPKDCFHYKQDECCLCSTAYLGTRITQ